MRIPPPLLFVATFLAGAGLQRLAPLPVPSAHILQSSHFVGLGLVVAAGLMALYCVGTFLVARTTIVPFGSASELVTWGPYRLTRNPMYVSLVLAYVGVAALIFQIVPLGLLPLPVILISRIVIPFEERRMQEVFGETYVQYRAKVRRWL